MDVGTRVSFLARGYEHVTGETYTDLGIVTMYGTVQRVWSNGKNLTVVTDDGKTYVRLVETVQVERMDKA